MLGNAVVEVYVIVDESGDYECGRDMDAAQERYDGDYGAQGGRRVLKLTVTVPMPATVELAGVAPPEGVLGKLMVS